MVVVMHHNAPQYQRTDFVQGVPVNEFSQSKIDATIGELLEEKDAVKHLIPA